MQLSWEPVKMVSPAGTSDGFLFATLELSNLDLLYDYYNSVLLIYDVQHVAPPCFLEEGVAVASAPPDQPVTRLICALEELLVHYPSAAGLLVHNESNGRLEVRYLMPASSEHMHAHADLSNLRQHCHMDTPSTASMFGVQFHVAHADVSLSDLGDVSDPQPCMDVLYPIMQHPTEGQGPGSHGGPPGMRCIMAFQLTTFKCGGFTLALTFSHLYADGFTVATFLQSLCSIARGAGVVHPPDFSKSRRVALSPRQPPSPTMSYIMLGARERSAEPPRGPPEHLHYGTATRFLFSMDALEALRVHASTLKPCSRTQALMALLWTAFASVKLHVHGLPGSYEMPLRFTMNLRTRGIPNVPPTYIGNALYSGSAFATLQKLCESPLSHVVDKIRSVLGDSLDLVEAFQSVIDEIELKLRDGLVLYIKGGIIGIPSLVGLPFYDTDCGWGCPIYVGRPSQQLSNRCIILDHPTTRAWNVLVVFASEEEHTCFEKVIANYIGRPRLHKESAQGAVSHCCWCCWEQGPRGDDRPTCKLSFEILSTC